MSFRSEKCLSYITVVEHFVQVDALRVEHRLLLSALRCGFAQQAARQAFGLRDDGVVGQRPKNRSQVKVYVAHWQDQAHL